MITYTTGRNLLGQLSLDTGTTNLTRMDTLHNEMIRRVISKKSWSFRQKTNTRSTVASQQAYPLPADCAKFNTLTVTQGTTKYSPRRVKTRDAWNRLNATTSVTSDTPEYYFILAQSVEIYPKPATSTTDAITYTYLRKHKDLSIADYTTGTIFTATNGSTTLTGTTTSWTASMAGRWIKITESNTANNGDGKWYEISSVASATSLTLVQPYEGTSISAGTATYTIGQTSMIPEDFQMLPIYMALEIHFTSIQPEPDRAANYKQLAQELYAEMQAMYGTVAM